MKTWHIVAIAAVVAVAVMAIVPHVPFFRDLVTPKPAK